MADQNTQKLTALTGYLEFLLNQFPAPEGEDEQEDPLILVLVCCQKTIERRIAKRVPTIEWANIQKWAVIEAEKLLDKIYDVTGEYYDAVADWNPTTTPQNMQQNLAAMLMAVQHELIGDIGEAETYLAEELKLAAEEFATQIWAEHEGSSN
jgi:hypothetical protein